MSSGCLGYSTPKRGRALLIGVWFKLLALSISFGAAFRRRSGEGNFGGPDRDGLPALFDEQFEPLAAIEFSFASIDTARNVFGRHSVHRIVAVKYE